MLRIEFYHLTSDGALTPRPIDSDSDYRAVFNLIAVCAAYAKVRVLAFAIEDTHIHVLLEGAKSECNAFKVMFERSYLRHVAKTRGTTVGARLDLDILPIVDEKHLMDIGTYVVAQPTKDGRPVLPYDYRWGTCAMYFRDKNYKSIWLYDKNGVLQDPVPAGSLSQRTVRTIACSKRKIPADWLICNGLILPENYVDVQRYEEIYRTHNAFRVFLSSNKQKDDEIKRREAAYLGVSLEDSEAAEYCAKCCQEMFGFKDIRRLNAQQRIRLAQTLRAQYRMSFRQLAKLTRIPLSEVQRYVS